ncbi:MULTISPECIES: helix-turn-helix domain-containing protein [unclassified Pseudoalteromonas]|uniref:helix-turn-helix domain-containing protein n=2 Tax=Pseudoalteromonas TaxID=53246 RepID=UPI002116314B|nr:MULTISPECIES: helix-turn-helix transcriptional regulator [unclassified Pseudoalteromonas]
MGMQSLGKELKRLRSDKKWTQAFAAREIGIQQSYLSKLENGQFIPSPEVIEKLKRCYGEACFDCYLPVTTSTKVPLKKLPILSFTLLIISLMVWLLQRMKFFMLKPTLLIRQSKKIF